MSLFIATGSNERNLKPAKLSSFEDLKDYPFTLKQDLRDNYPLWSFRRTPS